MNGIQVKGKSINKMFINQMNILIEFKNCLQKIDKDYQSRLYLTEIYKNYQEKLTIVFGKFKD